MPKFQEGDRVRVRKTGETGKIIGVGSLPLPRQDNAAYNVLPDSGPPSVNLLPEELEPMPN